MLPPLRSFSPCFFVPCYMFRLLMMKTVTMAKYLQSDQSWLMPTLSLPHPLPVVENNRNWRHWQRYPGFASQWLFHHMIQWKRNFLHEHKSLKYSENILYEFCFDFLILWGFKQLDNFIKWRENVKVSFSLFFSGLK